MHETLRPTLIHVHVDLLYAMLGLNQRRAGGNEDTRDTSRLRAARGLARIVSIDNSARLYSPIPLVVSSTPRGVADHLLTTYHHTRITQPTGTDASGDRRTDRDHRGLPRGHVARGHSRNPTRLTHYSRLPIEVTWLFPAAL